MATGLSSDRNQVSSVERKKIYKHTVDNKRIAVTRVEIKIILCSDLLVATIA